MIKKEQNPYGEPEAFSLELRPETAKNLHGAAAPEFEGGGLTITGLSAKCDDGRVRAAGATITGATITGQDGATITGF